MTDYVEQIIKRTIQTCAPFEKNESTLNGLRAQVVQDLVDLFQRPSQKLARERTENLPMKAEFFLLQALQFCHEYLWEANAYTDTQHNDFRAAVVSG